MKGSLISPHDDWLEVKELWKLEDISDAFVDFGEGKPVVTVDIKISEYFLASGNVLFAVTKGNLCTFLLNVS